MKAIERAVETVGSQQALAEAIGVTQGLVSQWVRGHAIHMRHFAPIERATRGAVTCDEIFQDELKREKKAAKV